MDNNYNPAISLFKCCKSPIVVKEATIKEILHEIKTGGQKLDLLLKARKQGLKAKKQGKKSSYYDKVKTQNLNTFSPNATFNIKRSLSNIKQLSGLIYLDIDGCTEIDLDNPYIFATWLSLSTTGRGVLVKAEGLSEDNFSFAYEAIAKEIGLDVDPHAKGLARQVVISYDPDIYINSDSKRYYCKKEVPKRVINTPLTVPSKKKEEKKWERKGGKVYNNVRYDNLEDYDLEGKDYEVFDEVVMFSKFFIPQVIKVNRYWTISTTVHQLMALNPDLGLEDATRFIDVLNSRCSEALPKAEINKIKRDIEQKIEEGNLSPIPNWKRHTAFSDNVSTRERQAIGAKVTGRNRRKKTKEKIQECLDDWDLNMGRVTNKKIAEITGLAKKTVDKYSKIFKDQKNMINRNAKKGSKNFSP